jgi:hypothetical protein
MHRNTRQTLRMYHQLGLIARPPATRKIQDVRYEFTNPDERALYDGIQSYVERRFQELEADAARQGLCDDRVPPPSGEFTVGVAS